MTKDSNLEMYADPANYDIESGEVNLDNSILLALAKEANGPILELGCGTGRMTIPLAQQGFAMTGLDITPHMLNYARTKAEGIAINWICDDVRTFQLETQFPLIFTYGAAFQHMLARPDQEAMLQRVHQHLAPDGKFVVDIGFNPPSKMRNVPEPQDWYAFTDSSGRKIQVSGTDQYDHLNQIWHQTLYRRWTEADNKPKEAQPERLALRYLMPQEMESLLFYNGFQVISRYGNWQGKPMTEEDYLHIYVCTHR